MRLRSFSGVLSLMLAGGGCVLAPGEDSAWKRMHEDFSLTDRLHYVDQRADTSMLQSVLSIGGAILCAAATAGMINEHLNCDRYHKACKNAWGVGIGVGIGGTLLLGFGAKAPVQSYRAWRSERDVLVLGSHKELERAPGDPPPKTNPQPAPVAEQPPASLNPAPRAEFCGQCGTRFEGIAEFCSKCGERRP